jgi:hypothetical protein
MGCSGQFSIGRTDLKAHLAEAVSSIKCLGFTLVKAAKQVKYCHVEKHQRVIPYFLGGGFVGLSVIGQAH